MSRAPRRRCRCAKIWILNPAGRLVEILEQADGDRVGLLARSRSPGTQMRIGDVGAPLVEQAGEDGRLERLERLAIAEEAGHADEQIAVEERAARPASISSSLR